MKKYVHVIVLALCASLLSGGCNKSETITVTPSNETAAEVQKETVVGPMENQPVLDYEVPVMVPGIVVSQAGYEIGREKKVIFHSKRLPEAFEIVDEATGRVVFKGNLESPVYNEETDEYISYGDFSSLETEGDYYIECEYLGTSYPFAVREDYYEEIMEEAVAKLFALLAEETLSVTERPSDEVMVEKCKTISALLLACELFPKMQADGVMGEENKIPDVLDYAATQAAYLAQWQDGENGSLGGATGWYCAALAKLSYTYQKYESVDATRFLQAADKAWKYMEKNEKEVLKEERFFSAAELYRATGKNKYHTVAKELGKELKPDTANEALTYGAITYFSTRRTVNVDLCNVYLKDMMEQAELISGTASDKIFLVGTKPAGRDKDTFFAQMTVMVLVDYIITNEEYGSLIEDHEHYLMGRNELGVSYFDLGSCENPAQEMLSDHPVYLAKYIVILSEIMNRK
ncbi:MAG: glycoside hydrolase family 9 protein [Lachnospiraceae bacterium]|nr:glycoside hydrolase family 9 protein [Lachnospiraceae bacterium]